MARTLQPPGPAGPSSRQREDQPAGASHEQSVSLMPAPDKEEEPNNKNSPFLRLLSELKIIVVQFVPVRDIPSLRLVSASWAAAGAASLFGHGFVMRPYRNDMAKLRAISQHPRISKGVRDVFIYAGDVDRSQLETTIELEWRALELASYGQPASKIWRYVDAIFDEDRFNDYCNPETLGHCLPLLPNLETVEIISRECPVRCNNPDGSPFERAWDFMEDSRDEEIAEKFSHFLNNLTSIQRYSSILSSILGGCNSLKKIGMDAFPIDIFRPRKLQTTPEEKALLAILSEQLSALKPGPSLKKGVASVRELSISIAGAGYIRNYAACMGEAMAKFIGCFENLTYLNISYEVADEDEHDADECCKGFQASLFRCRFPHLVSLRFQGTDSEPLEVGKFLFRHRDTLKNLYIGECGVNFQDSTHKEILTYLRDHMSLARFELFAEMPRMYDAYFEPTAHSGSNDDLLRDLPDAKLLELYVIGKFPWPMADEDPLTRCGAWRRKFMGSSTELLNLGKEELEDLLGDGWESEGASEMEEEGEDDDGEVFNGLSDSDGLEVEEESHSEDPPPDELGGGPRGVTIREVDPEAGEWEDITNFEERL
ncbi:uncharacterized protein L3040_007065 [Drepanopeziza brunnea f. sp. 'multigermtubi']|uniref:uncharacterized protein n=1 Tax=Drepanopeziza brunnea f. sp. 'multigermtubi' TaxID=698441 RepID=UPI00239DC1FD|nr:hypothetical protein L3040_007065 [Drepanopeziza brunnea f. sp. 'multigermtubi']